MAATPPWAELPAAAVHEIARRIPCEVDRLRVHVVCVSWRASLAQLGLPPTPPQLPWLLRPSVGGPTFSCLLSGGIHRGRFPADVRGARYFGSYDGGWVFLAVNQTQGHMLVNFRTNQRFRLPDLVRLQPGVHFPMVILAATLSSPPIPEHCVAAAIIHCCSPSVTSHRHITFWRMGRVLAIGSIPPVTILVSFKMEDVVYHNGAFHFLTTEEHILVMVCTLGFHLNQQGGLRLDGILLLFEPVGRHYHRFVRARYLVESRGELLMVVKFIPSPGFLTSEISVFQMAPLVIPYDRFECAWNELQALDGRMLFVGPGCSRSYEVADFPGSKDGVYFLDDGSFYDLNMVLSRHYACNDNGKCWDPRRPDPVQRCFPPELGPSNYSSPVWLLP